MPFIITQPEIYYLGNRSIVPVEGLTRKELFDGISSGGDSSVRKGEQGRVIQRLQNWIPELVDETVLPGRFQCPNLFDSTYYEILLSYGRGRMVARVSDDLGKHLLDKVEVIYSDKKKKEEIADRFNGKSGVIVWGDYHWGGNEGQGLQLGRWSSNICLVFSRNEYTHAFQRAINALCHGAEFTPEIVREDKFFMNPLSYGDGTPEIEASIRDVSLDAVRAADHPVSEFMAWMQENATQVNTMGELVRLAVHSYLTAQDHTKRADAGKVATTLPLVVNSVGDQYLKLAQEAYAELHPPKNNRMDYLVH